MAEASRASERAGLRPPIAPRLVASRPDVPVGVVGDSPAGRILTAALSLFAERGFYGTSIRDIAKAVGVQSAALYGHFPSKEHILAELVLAGHEAHHRRLVEAVQASRPVPLDQLTAWVRAHVCVHAEYPVLTLVANTELHVLPDELARPALDRRHHSELLLVEIIEAGTAQGVFDPPHVWMSVAAIGGMGIRVASWYEPGLGLTPEEVAETYAEMAALIVRPKRRPPRFKSTASATTDQVLDKRGIERARLKSNGAAW
jgi:AcrR family transcriptional regulator